jgi:chromate reductase, NAD(P)H dehydrogenase (quinone)
MDILILVGSLRAGSWTAQLSEAAAALLPDGATARVYAGLGDLPHYDQDLDTDEAPPAVAALRDAVRRSDGLVVATPEYNGSMPGVLKNAIDWASRPRGSSPLEGLPVAVLSVSPSPRGAQWARQEAEKVLTVAGAVPLAASLGVASVQTALVGGHVADPDVERALRDLLQALVTADEVRQAA